MKRMLALLLAAMLILTLLPGCGKKDPGGDAPEVPENPSEQGGETPDVTPEPEPYVDPYEAVRTYSSEDQLTQSWGPDQIVEHLFFHPVIAYPQWAFHDCGASQSERYGLDDWMVTADEYAKILQSVYEKGYILVAIEDVWSEVTDESGTHMVRNTLKLPEGKKPLIISFDDVNYYPYMLEQGFTSKLVVGFFFFIVSEIYVFYTGSSVGLQELQTRAHRQRCLPPAAERLVRLSDGFDLPVLSADARYIRRNRGYVGNGKEHSFHGNGRLEETR